jgi:hypothetical protein
MNLETVLAANATRRSTVQEYLAHILDSVKIKLQREDIFSEGRTLNLNDVLDERKITDTRIELTNALHLNRHGNNQKKNQEAINYVLELELQKTMAMFDSFVHHYDLIQQDDKKYRINFHNLEKLRDSFGRTIFQMQS